MFNLKTLFKILLALGFIFFMKSLIDEQSKKYAILERKLKNGIIIRGEALEVNTSGNHSFGVVYLKVDSANTNRFVDTLSNAYYPYKVVGKRAEIYSQLPYDLQKGDQMLLESDKQVVTYYHNGAEIGQSSLYFIGHDGTDDVYLKTHTRFK